MDSNEGPNIHEHNSKLFPKNPLKHHGIIIEKHARKGWTGHFRRQVRRPKVPPEPKVRQVRRHLRRPNLPDRSESLLSGASFGSRMLPPQGGSAAETPFGGRTWFLPEGQKLGSHEPLASQNLKSCINLNQNMHTSS